MCSSDLRASSRGRQNNVSSFLGVNCEDADAEASGDVTAQLSGGSRVSGRDVELAAGGIAHAATEVDGTAIAGGVAVNYSTADAVASPSWTAIVQPGAAVTATRDVTIRSAGLADADSLGNNVSGALGFASGEVQATSRSTPSIQAAVVSTKIGRAHV